MVCCSGTVVCCSGCATRYGVGAVGVYEKRITLQMRNIAAEYQSLAADAVDSVRSMLRGAAMGGWVEYTRRVLAYYPGAVPRARSSQNMTAPGRGGSHGYSEYSHYGYPAVGSGTHQARRSST